MNPGRHAWLETMVAQLGAKVELYRRIETRRAGQEQVIWCLDAAVARWRAELAAAPVPASVAIAPAPVAQAAPPASPASAAPAELGPEPNATCWRNPVFWRDGRFRPFAGQPHDRMLASAAACRQLGAPAAAAAFERLASALTPMPAVDFSTPMPAPFVAGPQMDMFA